MKGQAWIVSAVALAVVAAFFASTASPTVPGERASSDAGGGPAGPGDPGPAIKPSATCGPSEDLTGEERSRNAQFSPWPRVEHAIHVLASPFEGGDTHYLGRGQAAIVGFEWIGGEPGDIEANITENADHDLRIVLDGAPVPGDWKQDYQPAYIAESQCGAAWSWDHDADGPGDGNGNGVGDYEGALMMWRAPLGPLGSGTYALTVELTFDAGATWDSLPGGTIVVR